MEFKDILGNFATVEEVDVELIEGSGVMVKLRNPNQWINVLAKLQDKKGVSQPAQKAVILRGRRVAVNKTKEAETPAPQETKPENNFVLGSLEEDINFLLDYVIAGWSGIEENGEPIPFSKEKALATIFNPVNEGTAEIVKLLYLFVFETSNFSKANNPEGDENLIKKS